MESTSSKIWVITGRPHDSSYLPPDYSTDPRQYSLPDWVDIPDDEFQTVANCVRAFRSAEDAIDFAYACYLDTVSCRGYVCIGGIWFHDRATSDEVLDIDW